MMKWRSIDELNKILVSTEDTLWESLPKMDDAALQVLLVIDKKGLLAGVITDGDIRRCLLSGLDLKITLKQVMNPNPRVLPEKTTISKAKKYMQQHGIRHIPLVDERGVIKDIITWADCFATIREVQKEKVVIMAGGKGTRLDPFTKILPKPMIPIGDKPIIEVIIDKFFQQGFSQFILSLGYKAEIIKMYFSENSNRAYQMDFVYEDQPLGTAGALGLLKEQIKDTFLVINCDIILEPNYSELVKQHKNEKNDLTIVGSVKDFDIPYGVLKTEGQDLLMVDEKPSYHFLVNTGLYVIEPKVLKLIKDNEFLHMTDLILRIKENGGKVGVYPYHGDWFDLGQWKDYRDSLRQLGAVE